MPISSFSAPSAIAKPGVCTSSTRPASPYEGQVIYETDTDKTLVWNGSAWVFLSTSAAGDIGLVRVIPSSGTNCTISATGVASVTNGSTSFTLNGVFSSTFDNYRIVISNMESSSPGGGYYIALGTSSTGANYYMGGYYVNVSTAAQTVHRTNNGDRWIIGTGNNGTKTSVSFDLCAPNLAQRTFLPQVSSYTETGFCGMANGLQDSTTQFTAFTLSSAGATFSSGDVSVYGYRK